MKHALWTLIVVVGLSSIAAAQEQPSQPTLTIEVKQAIQLGAKDMELWQLKAQMAAAEFEKARAALQALLAKETPTGYQINDKLELVKLPEPKPAADGKKP